MAKTQKYGIKFPIQIQSIDKTLVDLDKTKAQKVKSELMHVLFTPIGQRLRSPNFGTRLIQFLFNPNDNETFSDVLMEIKSVVKKWVPECILDNIDIYETHGGLGLMAKINYSVTNDDGSQSSYEIETKL